jgi:PiT family inorganic phosphate transporter/low-affinity inorganic phosphate transporter
MSIILEALSNINTLTIFLLLLALGIALFYEMINGFHDTANAVAMIIYTNSLKAKYSVIMSGIMNFLGVLMGGIGVAYAVVHLLPLDIIVASNQSATLVMIFAVLVSAVIWNLGTWYFGIPSSSSHALIGSLVGVGAVFGVMQGFELSQSLNWSAVYKVLTGLAVAPILGFALAYLLMKLTRKFVRHPKFYKTPANETKRKRPNFWMRVGIIATGAGVSFAHGANDGQKGMGLIMIILMGIIPAYYALDMSSAEYKIKQVQNSAVNLSKFYAENNASLSQLIGDKQLKSALKTKNTMSECNLNQVQGTTSSIATKLNGIKSYTQLSSDDRWSLHNAILCSDNFFEQVEKRYAKTDKDKSDYIASQRKTLVSATEYVPTWVIVAVALALSIGTMVGYKRIVTTIGEKIGSQPINYMQGTVAQGMAMMTILAANFWHAPVSTTHIVSSAVAGSMVAEPNGGIQKSTVKAILLSWIFTLPVTALLSAGIYYALSFIAR